MQFYTSNMLESLVEMSYSHSANQILKAVYTAHESRCFDILLEVHKSEHDTDERKYKVMEQTVDVTDHIQSFVARYHRMTGSKLLDFDDATSPFK